MFSQIWKSFCPALYSTNNTYVFLAFNRGLMNFFKRSKKIGQPFIWEKQLSSTFLKAIKP